MVRVEAELWIAVPITLLHGLGSIPRQGVIRSLHTFCLHRLRYSKPWWNERPISQNFVEESGVNLQSPARKFGSACLGMQRVAGVRSFSTASCSSER
jgi:hypothetical protein